MQVKQNISKVFSIILYALMRVYIYTFQYIHRSKEYPYKRIIELQVERKLYLKNIEYQIDMKVFFQKLSFDHKRVLLSDPLYVFDCRVLDRNLFDCYDHRVDPQVTLTTFFFNMHFQGKEVPCSILIYCHFYKMYFFSLYLINFIEKNS